MLIIQLDKVDGLMRGTYEGLSRRVFNTDVSLEGSTRISLNRYHISVSRKWLKQLKTRTE